LRVRGHAGVGPSVVPVVGVVVVNDTEGGFGSPVLASGTNTQTDPPEQPRRKPPSEVKVIVPVPSWVSWAWNGMPGFHVSVGQFGSAAASRRCDVLFVSVVEQSRPPLSPSVNWGGGTMDSDAAPNCWAAPLCAARAPRLGTWRWFSGLAA
jgi:hypothetical protein